MFISDSLKTGGYIMLYMTFIQYNFPNIVIQMTDLNHYLQILFAYGQWVTREMRIIHMHA